MKYVLTGLRYLLGALSVLAVLLTLVSVAPSNVWWVQAAGFPRVQTLLALAVGLLGLLLLGWPAHRRAWRLLVLASGVGVVVQAFFLVPYLPLAPKAVPDAGPAPAAGRLRLLVVNVLITNRQDALMRQLVADSRPDVLLVLEPDAWWARALRPLQPRFPYRVELPRADAYGMLLYSRLPLAGTQVRHLLQPGVPSIQTRLRLPDGRQVAFFGIHPTPPIPDNYPDGVGLRGRALRKIADAVAADSLPTIVAGDFNDVGWSGTTRQLTRTGRLRDVGLGRGLNATFTVKSRLIRWPLDHVFVSAPFRVAELNRLADVGSDHFPLYAELVLPAE